MAIEICSNLDWDTVTAIASLGLLLVTGWAAWKVNKLTAYANTQTDRERYEYILKEFIAADDAFHHNGYINRTSLIHLNSAELYSDLYACPEISQHIQSIKLKVTEAYRNFNKWDRFDVYPDHEHSKNELYNLFMDARDEANSMLENFAPFKTYIKVQNDL